MRIEIATTLFFCILALLSNTIDAREFRNLRKRGNSAPNIDNERTLVIPNTAAIDGDLLKAANADKFLSLWFIFVLGGSTKNAGEYIYSKEYKPWTGKLQIASKRLIVNIMQHLS